MSERQWGTVREDYSPDVPIGIIFHMINHAAEHIVGEKMACWRMYPLTGEPGKRDRVFLARTFQKLLLTSRGGSIAKTMKETIRVGLLWLLGALRRYI